MMNLEFGRRVRRLLIWRHRLLWSYRADLWVLLLVTYVVAFAVVKATFIYAWLPIISQLERSAVDLAGSVHNLTVMIDDSIKKRITKIDEDAMRQVKVEVPREISPRTSRILEQMVDLSELSTSAPLVDKLKDVYKAGVVFMITFNGTYEFFENTGAVVIVIVAPLLIFMMAFFVLNVFYSRETIVVMKHPRFGILMIQFIIILLLPIISAGHLESYLQPLRDSAKVARKELSQLLTTVEIAGVRQVENDPGQNATDNDLSKRKTFHDYLSEANERLDSDHLDERLLDMMVDSNSRSPVKRLTALMSFSLAFLSWIACGLWAVRWFGGGVFLACSAGIFATYILVTVTAGAVGLQRELANGIYGRFELGAIGMGFAVDEVNNDTATFWIMCLGVSGLLFLFGLIVPKMKRYAICAGFVGTMVATCGLAASMISGVDESVLTFVVLCVFVVVISACVELGLQRAMFKFLYEPR
jgi:hypothetical protein